MPVTNKIINTFSPEKLKTTVNAVLWLVLLITIITVFVPFSPSMPAAGFDQSWIFGLNQAMAQGLAFGKEMIFTFGPYASIYTTTYHPATDFIMVSGSLYLALSYWACFIILMKDAQWRWVLAFCGLLAGLMVSRDALLFSLPLLVGLVTFKIQSVQDGWLVKNKMAPFYMVLLFAPLGLLPLVKGSLLILCVAVAVLCMALFMVKRHRFLAIICLLSPMISMVFFWMVSGQAVVNLPGYFISMAPIVSGYTEAMALDGFIHEVFLYLVITSLLLLAVFNEIKINSISKIFLLCTFFVFLFVSFKAGFVRHDGHALIASNALLFGSLLLLFFAKSEDWNTKKTFSVTSISVFFYLLTVLTYTIPLGIVKDNLIEKRFDITSLSSSSPLNKYQKALLIYNVIELKDIIQMVFASQKGDLPYSSAWHGIRNRIENKNWPRPEFDAAVNSIRKQASFPVLPGTTDIYSYNQSYLIASGNTWSPRPIFQSYSVYTPELAEINRKHLLGNQAPDNIIFSVEPIDERLPSIEDGASWPILMLNYRPTLMENNFLFLQKQASISDIEDLLKLTSEKHSFGEPVNVPESKLPIFAQIEIKPTVLGRIASILFKPSQLQITLELKNGIKKQFRIIAGMAKSGFVLSPLIENTTEFEMLYGESGFLDKKQVKSFAIAPRNGKTMLWNDEYAVTFSQIKTSN